MIQWIFVSTSTWFQILEVCKVLSKEKLLRMWRLPRSLSDLNLQFEVWCYSFFPPDIFLSDYLDGFIIVHVLLFRKEFLKTCFNGPINDFTLVSLKLFLYTLDPHKYMNLKMYEFKLIATYSFRISFSYTLCTWSHIRQTFFYILFRENLLYNCLLRSWFFSM